MTQTSRPVAAIVLAAGKGTRMKSALHKVLHPIAGRPMLEHLLASVSQLQPERTVIVAGHGREQIAEACGDRATIVVQEPQLGTGHAVQQAEAALTGFAGDVIVLYGDVPFVAPATMRRMLDRLADPDRPAAVVGGNLDDVGQVVLPRGVVVGHAPKQVEQVFGPHGHHARVAQVDLALSVTGVLVFDHLDDRLSVDADHAPVSAGVGGLERQHHGRRTIGIR